GSGESIAAAAKRHGLDGDRGHAVLDGLNSEIVLIAGLIGAVVAVFIDADDVVHATAVSRNADHDGHGPRDIFRGEQIPEYTDARPTLEYELLAHVARELAGFERLKMQRRAIGEATQKFGYLRSQL